MDLLLVPVACVRSGEKGGYYNYLKKILIPGVGVNGWWVGAVLQSTSNAGSCD